MASSQTIAEAVENTLKAMNIVAQKNLETVNFDQTIKCKIIDISDQERGKYRVTDNSSTFIAYSQDNSYEKGDIVWVTIPSNDYNKNKFIVGKYVENEVSDNYIYVEPLKSFIDITGNVIQGFGDEKEVGLVANGDVEEITLWSLTGTEYKGYDELAISAKFKTENLRNFNVKSGNYGLKLNIIEKVSGTSQTSSNRKFYQIVFNCSEFMGDPYNFQGYFSQSKTVDISMIDCIETISLIFYQGKDFKTSATDFLEYHLEDGQEIEPNIKIKDPYISFGYDKSRFTEDTVLLYTLDPVTYSSFLNDDMRDSIIRNSEPYFDGNEEEYRRFANSLYTNNEDVISTVLNVFNKKDMYVRWIHFPSKDELPIIIDSKDKLNENYKVHWYQYILEEGINDELAGPYWQELNFPEKLASERDPWPFKYDKYYPPIGEAAQSSQKFKIIIEAPSTEAVCIEIYNSDLFDEFISMENTEELETDSESIKDKKTIARSVQNIENLTYTEWVNQVLKAFEQVKVNNAYRTSATGVDSEQKRIIREYENALEVRAEELGIENFDVKNPEHLKNPSFKDITDTYYVRIKNIRFEANQELEYYTGLQNKIESKLAEAKYYYSNILEFTSENYVADGLSVQLVRGLTLTVDPDGFKGNYRIYNEEGHILSQKESQKKRIITANWNSMVSGELGDEEIEEICWEIPTANTMIEYPQSGIEYDTYTRFPITEDNILDFHYYRQIKPLYYYDGEVGEYKKVPKEFDANTAQYYTKDCSEISPSTEEDQVFKIYRLGKSFEEHEPGTEEPNSCEQVFRIKETYSPNLVNNTIRCKIKKGNHTYQAEATLYFGPTGTAGTDYTFELEIQKTPPTLTPALTIDQPDSIITVIPHLYNYKKEDIIQNYIGKLRYSWWSGSYKINEQNEYSDNILIINADQDTSKKFYTSTRNNGSIDLKLNVNSIEEAQYFILQAEIVDAINFRQDKKITLTTFKPIPVRSSAMYVGINGAERISYNSSGINPSYYKDAYQIYQYIDKKTVPIDDDEVSWVIDLGIDTNGILPGSPEALKFYPQLSEDNTLVMPAYYLRDNGKQIAVNCIYNNDIIWTQPLYIYQNSYSSIMLNSWDGKLTIDEENGTILSTVVGAGGKDDKNRFNGVLMGDLNEVDETPEFGLYGYHEGHQSFGFKIDGTAFLGKSGKGQINFNGNSGTISSLSHNISEDGKQGMLIDLDDGFIDIYGGSVKNVFLKDNNQQVYTVKEALNYIKIQIDGEIRLLETERDKWDPYYGIVEREPYQDKINIAKEKRTTINNLISQIDDNWTNAKQLQFLQDKGFNHLITDEETLQIDYQPDQSHIRISATDPFLTISSKQIKVNNSDEKFYKELIKIGTNVYYLQTDDFKYGAEEVPSNPDDRDPFQIYLNDNFEKSESGIGSGLLFDLKNGQLLGYNFRLKSTNTKEEHYIGTYFELNSKDPFLKIHLRTNEQSKIAALCQREKDDIENNHNNWLEKDLIEVSTQKFWLQSFNYYKPSYETTTIVGTQTEKMSPTNAGAGVLLDLTDGKLIGHDFELQMIDSEKEESTDDFAYGGSYILLRSSGDPYFRIHFQQREKEYSYEQTDWTKQENGEKVNKCLDLINISKYSWEIKSKDYQAPTGNYVGKGIRLDLNGNSLLGTANSKNIYGSKLEAYSFGLEAYKPGLYTRDVSKSIIINSAADGSPISERIITPIINENYIKLPPVSGQTKKTIEQIQTAIDNRYNNPASGKPYNQTYYDVLNSKINGISPIEEISKEYKSEPLSVGALFSVDWEGKVTAGWLNAKFGGVIGPFTLSTWALYSNNGLLANGKAFLDSLGSNEPEPQGVYLGKDGFSVRNAFAVYHTPINKSTSSNISTQYYHTMRIPTTDPSPQTICDFIQGANAEQDHSQYFKANVYDGSDSSEKNFYLKDLSFFLKGNSVIDGITAINGNSYIFGNLQIGTPPINNTIILGSDTKKTKDHAVIYANTSIFGVFRTTGMSYIGDSDGRWQADLKGLRNDSRDLRNALTINHNDSKIGFIVYRNSYISGYLRVAGSMVVGDSNIGSGAHSDSDDSNLYNGATEYDGANIHGDFTAYVKNAKFFGDLEVAAGFVAGSMDQNNPVSNDLAQIPKPSSSGYTSVPGSGIQSRYIFLGRRPDHLTSEGIQSDLTIFANTEQWGNFIAGKYGQTIELYSATAISSENIKAGILPNLNNAAFIKMNSNGIQIQTGGSDRKFSLLTNGGDIEISGEPSDNSDHPARYGGNISIKAGSGKTLDLRAGADNYINFDNAGKLAIKSTGSMEINIQQALSSGGYNTGLFKIDNGQILIQGTGSSTTNGKLEVNADGSFSISTTGNVNGENKTTSIVGQSGVLTLQGADISITGPTAISGNLTVSGNATIQGSSTTINGSLDIGATTKISGDCYVTGNIYAANLKFDNNGGVSMGGYPSNAVGTTPQFNGKVGGSLGGTTQTIAGWTLEEGLLKSTGTPYIALNSADQKIEFNTNGYIKYGSDANNATYINFQATNGFSFTTGAGDGFARNLTLRSGGGISLGYNNAKIEVNGEFWLSSANGTKEYYINGGTTDAGNAKLANLVVKEISGSFKAKNDETAAHSFSDLRELAFAENIKKKFRVNLNNSITITAYTKLSFYTSDSVPVNVKYEKVDFSKDWEVKAYEPDGQGYITVYVDIGWYESTNLGCYISTTVAGHNFWFDYVERSYPHTRHQSIDVYYDAYKEKTYTGTLTDTKYVYAYASAGGSAVNAHDDSFNYTFNWKIDDTTNVDEGITFEASTTNDTIDIENSDFTPKPNLDVTYN